MPLYRGQSKNSKGKTTPYFKYGKTGKEHHYKAGDKASRKRAKTLALPKKK
jgi:hypothetical protein